MLSRAKDIIAKSGKKMPQVYTGSPYAWQDLLKQQQPDGVIIATPWEWHKEMVIGSLEAGLKYVATEVILGITLQDHWDVVKAAEHHNANVMMLENVCYRRDVLAVLNMVQQGLFGEIIHLQGGYQHNLRGIKFNNGQHDGGTGCEFGEKAFSEARWRTEHSVHRNGDLYPTHGIGPLAHYAGINRGNTFTTLCSFSSKTRGLHDYVVKHCGESHPSAKVRFKLGDVVTTSINCANGETILLQHDTNLPRPYSLGFRVQGTGGLWMDVANGIYIEGQSKNDDWDAGKIWLDKYDHPCGNVSATMPKAQATAAWTSSSSTPSSNPSNEKHPRRWMSTTQQPGAPSPPSANSPSNWAMPPSPSPISPAASGCTASHPSACPMNISPIFVP
jgi:hypothetical protein